MKQHTAEELKVMDIKEIREYFDRLHKANA